MNHEKNELPANKSAFILASESYRRLVLALLDAAQTSGARGDYLKLAAIEVLKSARADWVDIRVRQQEHYSRCLFSGQHSKPDMTRNLACTMEPDGGFFTIDQDDPPLFGEVAKGHFDPSRCGFSTRGSAWANHLPSQDGSDCSDGYLGEMLRGPKGERFGSSVLIPLIHQDAHAGLLRIAWSSPDVLSEKAVPALEDWAQALVRIFFQRMSVVALRERVKELTCLYGIARVLEQRDLSVENMLAQVVELLPPAWQYPEITSSRIVLGQQPYLSRGFVEGRQKQAADILIAGQRRGQIEVFYWEDRPTMEEGLFSEKSAA